jgi:Zn-dependent M28 family amino/carboxypeptidase
LFFSYPKLQNQNITIDLQLLLEHLQTLSSDAYQGRLTGTEGNKKARDYIINHFKRTGVQSFESSYEQPFSFKRGDKNYQANNVIGLIPGSSFPDQYIVISAHHDHLGKQGETIFNGADDNASGVAALLIFADYLKKHQPKHSVMLVAFDAEELGLRGSQFFVSEMKDKDIVLNMNMDMISRSAKDELYVSGSRFNELLEQKILSFENPTSTRMLIGHDGMDGKQDWTYASDHASFYKANIPFLYFGNEDHKDYHGPNDDFELITPEFYKNAVTIILSLFQELDKQGF